MPDVVGFTGTRSLRPGDVERIRAIVDALPAGTRVVTGGGIGVDAVVARLATSRGLRVHTIVPADRSRITPIWPYHCDTYWEMPAGSSYRDRNAKIVELSDRLIAFPEAGEDDPRSRRSGTWQTIRIARRAGKTVEVVVLDAAPMLPYHCE